MNRPRNYWKIVCIVKLTSDNLAKYRWKWQIAAIYLALFKIRFSILNDSNECLERSPWLYSFVRCCVAAPIICANAVTDAGKKAHTHTIRLDKKVHKYKWVIISIRILNTENIYSFAVRIVKYLVFLYFSFVICRRIFFSSVFLSIHTHHST